MPIDDEHTEALVVTQFIFIIRKDFIHNFFFSRERAEEVEFLEDCLKPRDPIKCTEWKFDSIPDKSSKRISRRLWNAEDMWEDAIQKFKKDLKYWSYRIPPGYNTKYKFPVCISIIFRININLIDIYYSSSLRLLLLLLI
jgi:hypothetical protein